MIEWFDFEETPILYKSYRDISYYRNKIFEGVYKNSVIEVYRITSDRYNSLKEKSVKIAKINYSYSVITNGIRIENENKKTFFLLNSKTTNKKNVRKLTEEAVFQNWYVFSGESKFDADNLVRIQNEETLIKEILVNFSKYFAYFDCGLNQDNVYDIVDLCVKHNDVFKKIFGLYNSYAEEHKKYEKLNTDYYNLPASVRDTTIVTGRKEVTVWRIRHEYSGYWGIDEIVSYPEREMENIYADNPSYIKPPSREKVAKALSMYENEVKNLKSLLK